MNDQPEIRISPFSATQNRVARHFFSFFQCWYLLRFGLVSIFLVVCCCCSAYSVARSTGLTATSNRRWYFRFISFHLIWFDLFWCLWTVGRCRALPSSGGTRSNPWWIHSSYQRTASRRFSYWIETLSKSHWNPPPVSPLTSFPRNEKEAIKQPDRLIDTNQRRSFISLLFSSTFIDSSQIRCSTCSIYEFIGHLRPDLPSPIGNNHSKEKGKQTQRQQQNKKRLFVSMELDTRFHQLSLIPPQSTTTIKKKKNVWLDLISTVIATAHLTQSWAFKHPFFIYIYIYIQLLISNF